MGLLAARLKIRSDMPQLPLRNGEDGFLWKEPSSAVI